MSKVQRQTANRLSRHHNQRYKNSPTTHSMDNKICVLDGTNLRQLRDGLSLCSPGIVEPGERLRKAFWKEIGKLLLAVCGRNSLTSEIIRSPNVLNALRENFLDEGVQKLVECQSSLSGKAANAAIKKPQCNRLEILDCLAELENEPGKKVLRNLENGATICYKSDLGNYPEVLHGKTKQRVY